MHVILDFGHMMYGLIHIGVLNTANRKLFGAVRNCMVDGQHSMHEFAVNLREKILNM